MTSFFRLNSSKESEGTKMLFCHKGGNRAAWKAIHVYIYIVDSFTLFK